MLVSVGGSLPTGHVIDGSDLATLKADNLSYSHYTQQVGVGVQVGNPCEDTDRREGHQPRQIREEVGHFLADPVGGGATFGLGLSAQKS